MIPKWSTGTRELAPGVFAYVQAEGGLCVANAGIINADNGATLIDALFTKSMTRDLLEATRKVTNANVTRVINTHHHVDHTLGNANVPAEAEILAHARASEEQQRTGLGVLDLIVRIAPHFKDDLAGAQCRLPDNTFDGPSLDLEIGGRNVRLLHFGTGHTRGDVIVHLPEDSVLFLGDLCFSYVTPLAHEGHVGNWITIGHRILDEIDAETLVPGHGPVGTKEDLRRFLGYLERIRDGARKAFDAAATQEEAARSIDLGEYAEWTESNRIIPNVNRLYQEFRGELEEALV